jgi:hypothetical protein
MLRGEGTGWIEVDRLATTGSIDTRQRVEDLFELEPTEIQQRKAFVKICMCWHARNDNIGTRLMIFLIVWADRLLGLKE